MASNLPPRPAVPPLRAITVDGKTVRPTRQEIRAFAVTKIEEIAHESTERGANYQHLTLDLKDQADTFAESLDENDRAAFFRVLQEELEAAASAINQRGAKAQAEAIGMATGKYHVVLIGGAIIVSVFVYLIFGLLV